MLSIITIGALVIGAGAGVVSAWNSRKTIAHVERLQRKLNLR